MARRSLRTVSRLAALATVASVASVASAAGTEPMPSPIDGLGSDAVNAVAGWQFLYLGAAVAATVAMSPTGADQALRVGVQKHLRAPAWGDAAYYGGYVLPIVVPASLYVAGLIADDRRAAGAGSAALQALAFTEVATLVLKVGTGRPYPLHGGDPSSPDRLRHPEYAHEFSPFGFSGRYAWPSGHTSAAVSVAAALTAYYDGSWVAASIAYPLAAAIGLGMVVGDHHWSSDVVAGAFLGQGIGWSVGDSFAARARAKKDGARVRFVPLVVGDVRGLAVTGEL